MKTCLDDCSTFSKAVNMHYKDIKELTDNCFHLVKGSFTASRVKNGALRPKMVIWNAKTEQQFTEGKCQPCVSVCGWDALLLEVWPLQFVTEDALLVKLSFGVETFLNTIRIWPKNAVSVAPPNCSITSILDQLNEC